MLTPTYPPETPSVIADERLTFLVDEHGLMLLSRLRAYTALSFLFVHPQYRGRWGVNFVRECFAHAFDVMGVQQIKAQVHHTHAGCLKMVQLVRCGGRVQDYDSTWKMCVFTKDAYERAIATRN